MKTTYMPTGKNSHSQSSNASANRWYADTAPGRRRLPMLQLLGLVRADSRPCHPAQENHKRRKIGQHQSVITHAECDRPVLFI